MGSFFTVIRSGLTGLGGEHDAPYQALPVFYDRLMEHVNYREWARYIHSLIQKYGRDVKRVVDCGCGTGSLLYHMVKFGYKLAGFDLSLGMVRQAFEKTELPLWQGDLTSLALRPVPDALVCLYDSIHYLPPDNVSVFFRQAASLIRPGGLLIFDAVTENHILRFWDGYRSRIRNEDWSCLHLSWYQKRKRVQHTKLILRSRKGRGKYVEHHRQYILPLSVIGGLARQNGWKIAAMLNGFTLDPGGEDSDRVHFILEREAV